MLGNGISAFGNHIVDQAITSQGALQGPANVTTALSNLGAADSNGYYYLVFGLSENNGSPTTNAAIGIDNVKVSAVPLPGAIWLLGSGLAGLAGMQRRKHMA